MNPLQNPMAAYMGPGLGGLWAGEQQQLAVNDAQAQTGLTLEQIATQAQNRDINSQKLPLELEKMREEIKGMPIDREYKQSLTAEGNQRISRNNYNDFLDDLGRFQPTGTPADQGAFAKMAQDRKLPPDHPLVKMAIEALNDPKAFAKLQEGVAHGSMAARGEAQKQAAEMEKIKEQGKNQLENTRLSGQNQREVEQMRIDAGKYDKVERVRFGLQYELGQQRTAAGSLQVVNKYIAQARFDPDMAPLIPMLQEMARRLTPQAQQELAMQRTDPNKISATGVTGLPGNQMPSPMPAELPGTPQGPGGQALNPADPLGIRGR